LQAFAEFEEIGSDLAYQQDKENLQAAVHYFDEVDNLRLTVDGLRLRLDYRYSDQDWTEDDDDALASEDSGPWLELDEETEFAADDRPWHQPEVPGAAIHNPTYRVQLNLHHF